MPGNALECGHSEHFSSERFRLLALEHGVSIEHGGGCVICAVVSALLSDDGARVLSAKDFLERVGRKRLHDSSVRARLEVELERVRASNKDT